MHTSVLFPFSVTCLLISNLLPKSIITCMVVTADGVWIGNRIYRAFIARKYV
jgi:hypothetical protein